jgi:hypothetical protein
MVNKFTSANSRLRQSGFGVPHIEDWRSHIYGSAFRHTSDQLDMQTTPPGFSGTTVQTIIDELASMISAAGSGFISIGDVSQNLGDYNVGAIGTLTLEDTFKAAFLDPRLADGGIILVLAGFYTFTAIEKTVVVPPGISIMGELAGTIISSEMAALPMFEISAGIIRPTIGGDSGGGEISLVEGSPSDYVKFFNLTLGDNLMGTIGSPSPVMSTVPMIQCDIGSFFECEEVRFIGRVDDSVPVLNRTKTLQAIGYTGALATSTHLTMRRCYFDGMRTAIDFQPNHGSIDSLTVDKCRARTFGTESAVLTAGLNCFVSMSNCNATIANNYHVGAVSTTPTVSSFCVLTAGVKSADCKVVLSGNSGGSNTTTVESNLFVDSLALGYVKTVHNGNSWGTNVNNEWFIIVGSSTPSLTALPGDFVGSEALDILFDSSSNHYSTTVIVNPGNYTVTKGSGSRYCLVGNKIFGTYPVITLNIASAASDTYTGNRFLTLSRSIKSIQFTSVAQYHSIVLLSFSTSKTEVDDCKFTNVALIASKLTIASQKAFITVSNSDFIQNGSFADNISILLPSATSVVVENCRFTGNGYVGGIGTVPVTYTHSAQLSPRFIVRNCIMDQTGVSPRISARSPLNTADFDHYFWINETTASLVFENCKVFTSNVLSNITNAIHVSLTHVVGNPADFDKFICLYAKEIIIDNCLFNGPVQDFNDAAGLSYAMPTVFASPLRSLRFENSKVIGSALPLQIGGVYLLTDAHYESDLEILDSEFNCSDTAIGQTIIDVDRDFAGFSLNSQVVSSLIISGNNFVQRCTVPSACVQHTHITSALYDSKGVVQAYVPGTDIFFNNNRMYATVNKGPAALHPLTSFVGVYLDNFTCDLPPTTQNTNQPRTIFVYDNNIEILNIFTSATATDNAECLKVKSNILQIHNNRFNMYNTVGAATNHVGCLYLSNLPSTSTPYSEALVSENIFSRRSPSTGVMASLVGGYVEIDANSGRGVITDNAFDDYTFNGSSTVLVLDGNVFDADQWFVERNKNQTGTISLRGMCGQLGMTMVPTEFVVSGKVTGATNSFVYFVDNISYTSFFSYADTTTTQYFCWHIQLADILPEEVTVISASCVVNVSATPDTTSIVKLAIVSNGTEDFQTVTPLSAPGPTTLTVTVPGGTTRRLYASTTPPSVYLLYTCKDSAAPILFEAKPIAVTYRW